MLRCPPFFNTRHISANPLSRSAKFLIPNAAVTASKDSDSIETIPLIELRDVLNLNAEERSGDYSDILTDVERHEITVSNRMENNPQEELPETITLEIHRIRNTDTFSIYCDEKGYYIPRRESHIGKDGILYQGLDILTKFLY